MPAPSARPTVTPWLRRLAVLLLTVGLGAAAAQTLRVGTEIPAQLDPAFASADAEILVLSNVYDYLVEVDAGNQIQPGLASSWTTSDDGTVWTFALREDVTFHSGAAFGPDDVVATFDRLRDPDAGLPTSDLYANVAAVEATGPAEVTFTLNEPNPFFLFDLSDNHAVVVDADARDLGTVFDGTGPFQVTAYAAEDRMSLVANEAYFGGAPGVDAMELIFFADQAAAVSALRGGQIDLVLRMPTPLYQSLEGARGIERFRVATNAFDLVRLRSDRAPGDLVFDEIRIADTFVDAAGFVQIPEPSIALLGGLGLLGLLRRRRA